MPRSAKQISTQFSDKIRNFILMGLSSSLQEKYYDFYWNKIEKNTNYDVSSFIRDYLTAVRRSTPAIRKVYTVFKEYVKESSQELENLLADLLKYSKYMNQITSAVSPYPLSNIVLARLNLLEMGVLNPYLLALMDYAMKDNLKDDDIVRVLSSIEIYLFRRWVCNVPTNALNKVFETLHGDRFYSGFLVENRGIEPLTRVGFGVTDSVQVDKMLNVG